MIRGYKVRTREGWAMHDAVTVASLLDPHVITTAAASIEVDTTLGRGQTVVEFRMPHHVRIVGKSRYSTAGQIRIATGIDLHPFGNLS